MAEETSIGLAELIEQVKRELLTTPAGEPGEIPLLAVDTVELELQVTVKKEGKAGIKVYVLEAGGGVGQDEVQRVKVTLSPLLSKEMLLEQYQKQHPEMLQTFITQSLKGLMKTVEDGSQLKDQF